MTDALVIGGGSAGLMAAEALLGGDCPHCPEPPPPCHEVYS